MLALAWILSIAGAIVACVIQLARRDEDRAAARVARRADRRRVMPVVRARAMLVACFVVAAGSAFAADPDRCPTLPSGSGLTWTYREGPDFDLCYAQRAGSAEPVFGLYVGYEPAFRAEGRKLVGNGTVGGHPVTWYDAEPRDAARPLGRETLLALDRDGEKHPLRVHVWVHARTQTELDAALAALGAIRFH